MGQRQIKLIISVLVITFSAFFIYANISSKSKAIHSYQSQLVNKGVLHIRDAKQQLHFASETETTDRIPLALKEAEKELEMVKEMIGVWSVYFTYKQTDNTVYGGNAPAEDFFRAYQRVLFYWQNEIIENPNSIDVKKYKSMEEDLSNVYEAFAHYTNNQEARKDLTYEEVMELLQTLVKETKTKEVRQRLEKQIWFSDYND